VHQFKKRICRNQPEPLVRKDTPAKGNDASGCLGANLGLLIAGGGAVVGSLFAIGLSEWLMRHYEMMRLPPFYVAIGVLAMLVLGQAAVLVPARRASNVPPFVAARSA
jgi:hypothetical protein